jgi:DNA polymerase-3 subunit alpha
MSSKFIHLHTHSHYSLLDGLTKIEDMVKIAKSHGMEAIALTDHGNMHGAIDFYKACKKEGVKPIVGVEAYMAPGRRDDKSGTETGKRYYHLILLAKNLTGYKNLMKLVSRANLEGFYYKPRMDKEILREHGEGLICLSACMGGELSQTILSFGMDRAKEVAREYQDIFGKENYFIEIQSHPHIERDEEVRDKLVALAKDLDIPTVATQDSHYPCKDDHEAHRTLLKVNTHGDGKDGGKFEFSDDDFSLINEADALTYFKGHEDAVYQSKKIADMCEDYDLELGNAFFPNYEIESGKDADTELRDLAYAGFSFRKLPQEKEYTDRLEYELEIIKKKGYPGYFLVVADLLRFARENKILTNIRGSVAGSLTTYLVGITNVDPLVYKLPFERFLNPERPSLPDIDMDFADNRRDEMIAYAKKKYGEDRVAQIGTFGTMMAKGSVRDVARALGYPYTVGDRLASMIPLGSQGFPMTIDHAFEMVPEFKDAYEKEPDTKKIIDLAKKMEGCVRHVSVHAAGVVIAPSALTDFTPIQRDPKGEAIITQYDMHCVEDAGLPKFDFLGIRNLAILSEAVRLVKRTKDIDVDIENVEVEDKKTFEMLARGETMGVFQLNGSGMTKYLKDLKPSTIHDINAMVALYRPGPLEMIPEYIERKHNSAKIRYLDPRMKEILSASYGVITYQDDVMLIAIHLGGYSWLEADKLRKAMGKKIPAEMALQKEKLISGLIENGMTKEKAVELWALIEPFAAYGFNKAHAASYGRVAYQTAYMKANFPVEYMCAILTAESGDVDKIGEIIHECKRMGITVLPPDINESYGGFTVIDEKTIRFGFYTIKNLGTDISDAIISNRKEKGPFISIGEFLDRIEHKNLNKKSLESLVKSGAMDVFGNRGELFANTEGMLAYHKESKENKNQISLFGGMAESKHSFRIIPGGTISDTERLNWEKELLGLYISGHPLEKYKDKIEKSGINIKKIKEEMRNGAPVTFAGIIETAKIIFTKNNERMAFLRLGDFTDTIEVAVFPKAIKGMADEVKQDMLVAIKGRVSIRNEEKTIAAEGIKVLE